jgi:hypothetical protein
VVLVQLEPLAQQDLQALQVLQEQLELQETLEQLVFKD